MFKVYNDADYYDTTDGTTTTPRLDDGFELMVAVSFMIVSFFIIFAFLS